MEIPKYYEIDLENFKIEFDNKKKVHVAINKKTGEKTNISVLGILMQMGILKPSNENMTKKINLILERLELIESKVGIEGKSTAKESKIEESKIIKEIPEIGKESDKKGQKEENPEKESEDILNELEEESDRVLSKDDSEKSSKKSNRDIKKEIMETVLEKTVNGNKKQIKEQEISPDVEVESEEEIDNWLEI